MGPLHRLRVSSSVRLPQELIVLSEGVLGVPEEVLTAPAERLRALPGLGGRGDPVGALAASAAARR
eukprot:2249403-Alexandrium_andersonii.AAC.1